MNLRASYKAGYFFEDLYKHQILEGKVYCTEVIAWPWIYCRYETPDIYEFLGDIHQYEFSRGPAQLGENIQRTGDICIYKFLHRMKFLLFDNVHVYRTSDDE